MRRREVIGGLAVTAAWPLAARAQQTERMQRIGILLGTTPIGPEPVTVFLENLRGLGWIDGLNARIEYRAADGDVSRLRIYATELVGQNPDVILVQSNPGLAALKQATQSIPVVFVQVADPVGSGFVDSLAKPGGNITGFTNFESSMGSKWLTLLKEIKPEMVGALLLLHPETAANIGFSRTAAAVAPSLGISLTMAGVHDANEIERAITTFSNEAGGGVIAIPHPITVANQQLIIGLGFRNRLPTLFAFRYATTAGALVSYGVDAADLYRRAACMWIASSEELSPRNCRFKLLQNSNSP